MTRRRSPWLVAWAAIAALGAASCGNVIGLDGYRGGDGGVDNGCTPGGGATELLDLAESAPFWRSLHGGALSIKTASIGVACGADLEVTMGAGDWVGVSQVAPFPVTTAATHGFSMEVTTTTASTGASLGVVVGDDAHWCQTPFATLTASSTLTVTMELDTLFTAENCLGSVPEDTSTVGGLYIYLNGGGTYYIDDVLSW